MASLKKFRADTSGLEADAKKRSADLSAKTDADRPKVSSPTPAPTKMKSAGQSFRDAFREARANGDKTFRWGSKSYTTDLASDKPKAPAAPAAPAKPKVNTPAPGSAGKLNTGSARPLDDMVRGGLGSAMAAPKPPRVGMSDDMMGMMGNANKFAPPAPPRVGATDDMMGMMAGKPFKKGGKVKKFAKGGKIDGIAKRGLTRGRKK